MARITVHAAHADGAPRRWTLNERIVAEHLESEHYTSQLLERLSWATADAEALESQSPDLNANLADDARRVQLTTRSRTRPGSTHGPTKLSAQSGSAS